LHFSRFSGTADSAQDQTVTRPLIFIGHSFGGNVIQQAIISATRHGSPHSDIALSTLGVVFLATPLRGSPSAKWGAMIAYSASVLGSVAEDRILKDLEEQSNAMMASLRDFSVWLFSYSVPVVCCFEKNVTDYSSRIGAVANIFPSALTTQLVRASHLFIGHISNCFFCRGRLSWFLSSV